MCRLALSGNKTVATLFQGAAKGSKVAVLNAETGEWAEGELSDTWSNGAVELGQGSIFKFTNPDTKAFRAVFVGSYLGQGAEVTLAIGSGYFGYPSPLLRRGRVRPAVPRVGSGRHEAWPVAGQRRNRMAHLRRRKLEPERAEPRDDAGRAD